jgi:nucleoside-diphosphate-sugar epimerase
VVALDPPAGFAYVVAMEDEQALDEALSAPRDGTRYALQSAPGDIIVLGAGGKMGPTLARMARRAASDSRRVIAVSRFSSETARVSLEHAGVETISGDLLDREFVACLPDAPNVVFMAGQKFGTMDSPGRTWMMNVVVPAFCAERYASSKIVAFSTGNVYPLVPVDGGGSTEDDPPRPVGEYAASCLGRERVFQHFSETRGTQVAIVRLNYANDLRYGVLTDIATKVFEYQPIPLAMGYVNVIWQRDANRMALELFEHLGSYPLIVNVTGTERLSVRQLALEFAKRFEVEGVSFEGTESDTALLSNTSRMQSLLRAPEMTTTGMIDMVAEWITEGKPLLNRATHFETRDGSY